MRIHTRTERDKFNHILARLDPGLSRELRHGFASLNTYEQEIEDLEYLGEWENFKKTEIGKKCLHNQEQALVTLGKLYKLLEGDFSDDVYRDTMLEFIKCSKESHVLAITMLMELEDKNRDWTDNLSDKEYEEFEKLPPQKQPLYVPSRMRLTEEPNEKGEMVRVLKHRHSIHEPFQ